MKSGTIELRVPAMTHSTSGSEFEQFYRTHRAPAVRWATALVGSPEVGEEIAQDSLEAVGRRLATLANPGGYLRRTVVNRCASWHRWHVRAQRRELRSRIQTYTSANTDPSSSYIRTVTITIGDYRGQLELLTHRPDPTPVTVAGLDGWKVIEDTGWVDVVWQTPDSSWATMRIDPALAEGVDGLIAAVQPTDAASVSPAVPVPAPESPPPTTS